MLGVSLRPDADPLATRTSEARVDAVLAHTGPRLWEAVSAELNAELRGLRVSKPEALFEGPAAQRELASACCTASINPLPSLHLLLRRTSETVASGKGPVDFDGEPYGPPGCRLRNLSRPGQLPSATVVDASGLDAPRTSCIMVESGEDRGHGYRYVANPQRRPRAPEHFIGAAAARESLFSRGAQQSPICAQSRPFGDELEAAARGMACGATPEAPGTPKPVGPLAFFCTSRHLHTRDCSASLVGLRRCDGVPLGATPAGAPVLAVEVLYSADDGLARFREIGYGGTPLSRGSLCLDEPSIEPEAAVFSELPRLRATVLRHLDVRVQAALEEALEANVLFAERAAPWERTMGAVEATILPEARDEDNRRFLEQRVPAIARQASARPQELESLVENLANELPHVPMQVTLGPADVRVAEVSSWGLLRFAARYGRQAWRATKTFSKSLFKGKWVDPSTMFMMQVEQAPWQPLAVDPDQAALKRAGDQVRDWLDALDAEVVGAEKLDRAELDRFWARDAPKLGLGYFEPALHEVAWKAVVAARADADALVWTAKVHAGKPVEASPGAIWKKMVLALQRYEKTGSYMRNRIRRAWKVWSHKL